MAQGQQPGQPPAGGPPLNFQQVLAHLLEANDGPDPDPGFAQGLRDLQTQLAANPAAAAGANQALGAAHAIGQAFAAENPEIAAAFQNGLAALAAEDAEDDAPAQPQDSAGIIARATTSLYQQGAGLQDFSQWMGFLQLTSSRTAVTFANLSILAGILRADDIQWPQELPPDINTPIGLNNNLTPLTAAAIFGRFGVVQQMLLHNPTQENLDTALYNALEFGHLRVTQALMQKGARLSSEATAQLFGGNWLFWYRADLKEPLQKALKAMVRDYKTETASYQWAAYAIALPLLTTGFILHVAHAPSIISRIFLMVGMISVMMIAGFFIKFVFEPASKTSRFTEIPAIEQYPNHIHPQRLNALSLEEINIGEGMHVGSLAMTLLFSTLATEVTLILMAQGQYPSGHIPSSSAGIFCALMMVVAVLPFAVGEIYRFRKHQQPALPAAPQQPAARDIPPVSPPYTRLSFFGRCAGLSGVGVLAFSGFDMALSFQIAAGFWALGFFISNVLPELHAFATVGLPEERYAKVRTQKQCALALASFGALGLMGTFTAPGLFHLSLSINNTAPLMASTALFSAIVLTAMGLALHYRHKERHLPQNPDSPLHVGGM